MKTKNVYEFKLTSRCPVDNRQDNYAASLISETMIQAEDIVAFCDESEMVPIFQEDLATRMQIRFQASVHLVGWHNGIKVTCSADGEDS